MSKTCLLQQISSYALSMAIKTPSLIELKGIAAIDNAPKIDNLYGLSSEYLSLLREITPNPEQIVGELTLWDVETLAIWKAEYPEDFHNLKTDIYQMIVEDKVAPTLDLGYLWYVISYILTGDYTYKYLPFLVNETENTLKVNAILCGQLLDEDGCFRYLEYQQVQEIAEAFSRISQEVIYQRFAKGLSTQPDIYSVAMDLCFKLREFYISAANQENVMLISIM